ncbi:acetylornithine transaminase [Methanopyrus sp.]
MDARELIDKYHMNTYSRFPVTLVRGEGARVWDDEGNEYIDLVAGIAVNVLGHCHPAVVEAVKEQVERLIHCSNLYYNEPQAEAVRLLAEVAPGDLNKVFFCNSGTESVECAIKLARKFTGHTKFIAFEGGFHGRTMGALSATWKPEFREPFEPLVPEFEHVPYGDVSAVERAIDDDTAAIIVEPVQGEAGVRVPPDGFLRELRELCDEHGLLLIVDEVQSGMGRTGRFFAFEHEDVLPDIVCLAKGLGGGVPVGATIAREEVAEAFEPGDHGSTFGGNPLACAAVCAAVRTVLEENLPEAAERKGKLAMRILSEAEDVVEKVRGRGLMIGVEVGDDERAEEVAREMLDRGVLVNVTSGDVIRLVPPLVIGRDELEKALTELVDALRVSG